MMQLFDAIPQELFSVLASRNRTVYAQALRVLYEAFLEQLKISDDAYFSMLRSRLEFELSKIDFTEDGIVAEEDENLSGRTRFLIRKLREKGWLDIERGDNFEKYIVIPEYSIRLLELFNGLTHEQASSGFSYVYETYAALRSANETDTGHFEKLIALRSAHEKTAGLIRVLKTIYHNINRYFQQQLDMTNINQVLLLHFDDFSQKVIETHIRPLKIKDSVPKYKIPIMNILNSWLESAAILEGMAAAALQEDKAAGLSLEQHRGELIEKIFFIKQSYESFEADYLGEIDAKVRKYTRSTMQKVEYLTNSDRTVRGNIIFLLKALAAAPLENGEACAERIQDIIQLRRQKYISERSLYSQRRGARRAMQNPVEVDPAGEDLTADVRQAFADVLESPYTKRKIFQYMTELLTQTPISYTADFGLISDRDYIISLLAVLEADDKSSPYRTELLDTLVDVPPYSAPNVRFEKKGG